VILIVSVQAGKARKTSRTLVPSSRDVNVRSGRKIGASFRQKLVDYLCVLLAEDLKHDLEA